MTLFFESLKREYRLELKGSMCYAIPLGKDLYGNITRIDNALNGIEEYRATCVEQLENAKVQLANAKEQVTRPFPQEEELKAKTARLNELNVMLNLDKRESEVLDDGEISEEGAPSDQPQAAAIDAAAQRLCRDATEPESDEELEP